MSLRHSFFHLFEQLKGYSVQPSSQSRFFSISDTPNSCSRWWRIVPVVIVLSLRCYRNLMRDGWRRGAELFNQQIQFHPLYLGSICSCHCSNLTILLRSLLTSFIFSLSLGVGLVIWVLRTSLSMRIAHSWMSWTLSFVHFSPSCFSLFYSVYVGPV